MKYRLDVINTHKRFNQPADELSHRLTFSQLNENGEPMGESITIALTEEAASQFSMGSFYVVAFKPAE